MNRKLRMMLAIAIATIVFAPFSVIQAQSLDPEETVAAMYAAFNAGDAETAISFYADDAVVDFSSGDVYSGIEEIETWITGEIGNSGQVEFEIIEVDGGYVTLYTSFTDSLSDDVYEATEEFLVEDGLITLHMWTPLELSADPADDATASATIALDGRYGVIGEGSFFITDPTSGQDIEIAANFVGILTADGEGNVQGLRVLNGTSVYSDSVLGVYREGLDGDLTFTLEAYIEGEDTVNAEEEWMCFITDDGELFQCIITSYQTTDANGDALSLRVVASIEGTRLGDAP